MHWARVCVLAGALMAACTTRAAAPPLGLPPLPQAAAPPAQIALGRALFFERRLSANGTLSCAMCHVPEQAFTANELRTSVGMEGVSLRRSAPSLLNVAYVQQLFHDGRAASLEAQALMPLLHADEMANTSMAQVLRRMVGWPEYRPLFRRAFGDATPTQQHLATALAAYQRSLLAADAGFDRWQFGGQADALTAQQQRGFELFKAQGCARCHTVEKSHALFSDGQFHNTGVQMRSEAGRLRDQPVALPAGASAVMTADELRRIGTPEAADLGRQEVTGLAAHARAYRTPSLRNVALTAPYMHDGSFDTLEQVLDHYAAGGWPADPAQDPALQPQPMARETRDAILAFLRTLTSPRLPDCANAAPDRQACGPAMEPVAPHHTNQRRPRPP